MGFVAEIMGVNCFTTQQDYLWTLWLDIVYPSLGAFNGEVWFLNRPIQMVKVLTPPKDLDLWIDIDNFTFYTVKCCKIENNATLTTFESSSVYHVGHKAHKLSKKLRSTTLYGQCSGYKILPD